MTRAERIAELKKIRAYMDDGLPGWRDNTDPPLGPGGRIAIAIGLSDGRVLQYVLHMKPEPVTVEFGGTEFGEFEPGEG